MFVREGTLPQQVTVHGPDTPTWKRVLVSKGMIPYIMQIATSVSWDSCDTSFDQHVHETMWEFYFVHRGRAVFTIGNEVHEAEAGDFLAVPPNTTHYYKVPPGEELELFYFGVATD